MGKPFTSRLVITRADGSAVQGAPASMAAYIANLGIDSVQSEVEINGEKLLIQFKFDPPVIPKLTEGSER